MAAKRPNSEQLYLGMAKSDVSVSFKVGGKGPRQVAYFPPGTKVTVGMLKQKLRERSHHKPETHDLALICEVNGTRIDDGDAAADETKLLPRNSNIIARFMPHKATPTPPPKDDSFTALTATLKELGKQTLILGHALETVRGSIKTAQETLCSQKLQQTDQTPKRPKDVAVEDYMTDWYVTFVAAARTIGLRHILEFVEEKLGQPLQPLNMEVRHEGIRLKVANYATAVAVQALDELYEHPTNRNKIIITMNHEFRV